MKTYMKCANGSVNKTDAVRAVSTGFILYLNKSASI